MNEPIQLRRARGADSPSVKGEGAIYLIPASDLPDGDFSGKEVKVIIQGLINIDEQGGIIDVKRISIEDVNNRDDLTQTSIEKDLSKAISD